MKVKVKQISNKYYDVIMRENMIFLKNKNNGVVILPITQKGKILLINVYRENIGEIVMELPRGFVEKGEKYYEAAQRELKEETNCSAKEFIELGYVYPDSGITDSKITLFMATDCNVDNIILQEKEKIKGYTLLHLDDVIDKINSGEINDGFTISTVFRASNYFNNGSRL